MINIYNKYISLTEKTGDLSLLFIRLLLAYGFWEPAKTKWTDISSVAEWFESIGIVAPTLNAYLAASTEMAGVFLLLFGLGTRIIALPLIITMLVAIKTVHWQYGFPASENGFEIPLYYIILLLALISFGSGKISIDYLLNKKK